MLWKRVSQQKLLSRKHPTGKQKKVSNTMNWALLRKPKRKVLNIAMNRFRVKKKRKIRDVNGGCERTGNFDRISELPEPIIHHILSFLRCPKDVARTSVLSKKWRRIWTSFLTFDFDQKCFKAQKAEFKQFIEHSLSTRIAQLVCIKKFRLHLTSFDSKWAHHIDRWLCAATAKKVEELEIYVGIKKRRCYSLPRIVPAAETLTSLKLYGCKLVNYNNINLPNLKQLSIKKVRIDMNIIQSFSRSCPWIEDLRLILCTGLDRLHVSTLIKLNRLEVHECNGLKWVEIEVPSLQTFWCCGKRTTPCNINLDRCKNLRSLTLKDAKMTSELFQDQISKFPVLEKLVLKECHTLERIIIFSETLKRLTLIRCKKLYAIIDAPNLQSFEYTGYQMPIFPMGQPNLQEAKFYFESMMEKDEKNKHAFEGHNINLLNKLLESLWKFNQSESLKFVVRHDKDVIVYEELRDIQLLPFYDLKLEIISSSTSLKDLLDSLLWTTRPENLSVVSPSNSEFLKFLDEKMMNREANLLCCRYYWRKCWWHYLKDVKIKNEWTSVMNPLKKPSSTLHQTTTFKLEWTEG